MKKERKRISLLLLFALAFTSLQAEVNIKVNVAQKGIEISPTLYLSNWFLKLRIDASHCSFVVRRGSFSALFDCFVPVATEHLRST